MRIGKYKIVGRLGRGGMAVVYKAEQPLTGRILALKLCRPAEIMLDVAGPERIREMFLTEARAMGRVRHPNIASVLDAGEHPVPGAGPMPFFTMEYFCNNLGTIMGEEYEAQQRTRLFAVPRALHYARQMLEALRRLHYDGIFHRDVKPFNVMITEQDRAVLIDFGLSRLRGETSPTHPRGMVVGSPFYAAPEQEADPQSADARSDIYSVGVTLYRMLTGQLPETVPLPAGQAASRLRPELTRSWDQVFSRFLAPRPRDRFASARDALTALNGLEHSWERSRTEACLFHDPDQGRTLAQTAPPRSCPRTGPDRVPLRRGPEVFGLDALWRPQRPVRNDFREQRTLHGHRTVVDRATGLLWQAQGSEFPLDYEQALEYAAQLRAEGVADRHGWRLPTVDELCTLFLDRAEPGAFCLEPVFDPDRARLWSADHCTHTTAWYVDADMGFVARQDRTCAFYVRAVCAINGA